MKLKLRYPVTVIRNNTIPGVGEITSDLRHWKYHCREKRFFNIYAFLLTINRTDVLEAHYDSDLKDLEITDQKYIIINGSPSSAYYYNSSHKRTKLDEELDILTAEHADVWVGLSQKKITWKDQKLFTFDGLHEVTI